MAGSAEFVVHHDAYQRLVAHFGAARVVPEFYIPRSGTRRGGRVDLAILDSAAQKPVLFIEVKPRELKRMDRRPIQCDRYEAASGVKVICCRGQRMAKNIVAITLGALGS
jgi:hypothetical protein